MGHKTNGDWSDITSTGRNEIVFEGRHKNYGAYYVRQRYNSALLLSLLISLSVMVVAAGVPLLINLWGSHSATAKAGPKVVAHPYTYVVQHYNPKPETKKAATAPIHKPKPVAQTKDAPPVVVKQNPTAEVPTATQLASAIPGSTTTQGTKPEIGNAGTANPGPPSPPAAQPVFKVVQVMPQFRGDLNDYIPSHTQYPAQMSDLGISGTVWATFIVEPDGSISNVSILKGVAGGDLLDSEAVRVLRNMPAWKPGIQDGHAVRVQCNIPINFQLK